MLFLNADHKFFTFQEEALLKNEFGKPPWSVRHVSRAFQALMTSYYVHFQCSGISQAVKKKLWSDSRQSNTTNSAVSGIANAWCENPRQLAAKDLNNASTSSNPDLSLPKKKSVIKTNGNNKQWASKEERESKMLSFFQPVIPFPFFEPFTRPVTQGSVRETLKEADTTRSSILFLFSNWYKILTKEGAALTLSFGPWTFYHISVGWKFLNFLLEVLPLWLPRRATWDPQRY